MDSQFNTLLRSYHDNYLQYKLTANSSYQNAYQTAQTGLDNIINQLQTTSDQQQSEISSFYKQDVEGQLRDLQSKQRKLQKNILEQTDELTAAKHRLESPAPVTSADYTGYYIAIGVMAGIAGIMSFL
jgi:predicted aminopeptidase